jgi:hypothetical protein
MANSPFRRSLIVLLALFFGLAIIIVSVAPINRIKMGTRAAHTAPPVAIQHAAQLHIVVHVLIFGLAACIAWFAADLAARGSTNKMLALVMTLLLGCTTEYLQHALYHNAIELDDVLTNIMTVAIVFGLLSVVAIYHKPAPHPTDEGIPFILSDLD